MGSINIYGGVMVEDEAKRKQSENGPKEPEETREPIPVSDYQHINIGFPPYLLDELRTKTNKGNSTIRYELMRALRRLGYTVHKADLVKDGRRGKFIRKRAS